jgi:hemerythrin-like domain-containing protein
MNPKAESDDAVSRQSAGSPQGRREFLKLAIAGGSAFAVLGLAEARAEDKPGEKGEEKPEEEEVAPAEDLMREHGLLNRILLIYDESRRQLLTPKGDLDVDALAGAAKIVREFVEDYHEKLEENYLFTRFRKAGKEVVLVETLLAQHNAGRALTDQIRGLATASSVKDPANRHKLAERLESFNRMYRPHEAREDTILFPAFKKIVSPHEYGALGEDFEKKENELFGDDGFEKMVAKVADLEKKIGIYDLAQFTPKVE